MEPEIIAKLKEQFPKAQHKKRRLPGGGDYIYVPWEFIVDRLNVVCGMDWNTTYIGPTVVGDYLAIYCSLTIADITRQGVGTIKTYPELNDDGKEKIIGDPPNNATRDAFRDAAYMFGICRYLDDQAWALKWFAKPDNLNRDRVNAAMKSLGLPKVLVESLLAEHFEEMKPSDLSTEQCDRLIALIEQSAKELATA